MHFQQVSSSARPFIWRHTHSPLGSTARPSLHPLHSTWVHTPLSVSRTTPVHARPIRGAARRHTKVFYACDNEMCKSHATWPPCAAPFGQKASETLWHWNIKRERSSADRSALSHSLSLPANSELTFKSANWQLTCLCAAAVLLSAQLTEHC